MRSVAVLRLVLFGLALLGPRRAGGAVGNVRRWAL
jgi:hypothetical protein